jgi:oligopeptide/dipeptide ABC transporter ATP-binding protein
MISTEERLSEDEVFLEIKNLHLDFSVYQGTVQVLDGIELSMKRGEIFGVVGETGCGKTVTTRSILRLLESNAVIDEGTITFMGSENLLKIPEDEMEKIRGRKISIIFQEPMTSLNPTMRIADQVGEGILLHFRDDMLKKGIELAEKRGSPLAGLHKRLLETELNSPSSILLKLARKIPFINGYNKYPRNASRIDSVEILRDVGMPSPERIAMEYPHELSGGMRQRVLIAIALACQPDLIIADEPTTAVDVTTQAKILNLLLKLREERGTSILVITHNLGLIAEICDRVCVMYAGQIAEIGDVVDIFNHPLHPYTKGLMRAIHNIGDNKELEEIPGNVPILLSPPSGCRFHPRCPRVMKICSEKRPTLQAMETGHKVHCWLYQEEDA